MSIVPTIICVNLRSHSSNEIDHVKASCFFDLENAVGKIVIAVSRKTTLRKILI